MIGERLFEIDGAADLYKGLIDPDASERYFVSLRDAVAWEARHIRLMGKQVQMPRLIAYFGELPYRYSRQVHPPRPLSPALSDLRQLVVDILDVPLNSVLLNYYRDGRDSMSWHADDETELGVSPTIASVSLGGPRRFVMRHREKKLRREVLLGSGDLLVMHPPMQSHWQHALPKTAKSVRPRINLTFRQLEPNP